MDKKASGKAHFIKSYYDDQQSRVAFLAEFERMGRKNERKLQLPNGEPELASTILKTMAGP